MRLKFLKILNSCGEFTLQVDIDGFKSSVPRGTSRSKYEAKPSSLRDLSSKARCIQRKLNSHSFSDLRSILEFEKYTEKFGSEICLGVTYSLLRMLAHKKGVGVWRLFTNKKEAPRVISKIMGGGKHFITGPKIQEFLFSSNSKGLVGNITGNVKVYDEVKEKLAKSKRILGVDLEGGLVPNMSSEESLNLLRRYRPNGKVGVDIAGVNLVRGKSKNFAYVDWLTSRYKLDYVEDPFDEDEFKLHAKLWAKHSKVLIVGDDLYATNPSRLLEGIKENSTNACIVKPNQAGSLSKTMDFVNLAKKYKLVTVISHRSRETNDSILADLAVGLGTDMIKVSIINGERVSKLNRLIEIMEGE